MTAGLDLDPLLNFCHLCSQFNDPNLCQATVYVAGITLMLFLNSSHADL